MIKKSIQLGTRTTLLPLTYRSRIKTQQHVPLLRAAVKLVRRLYGVGGPVAPEHRVLEHGDGVWVVERLVKQFLEGLHCIHNEPTWSLRVE